MLQGQNRHCRLQKAKIKAPDDEPPPTRNNQPSFLSIITINMLGEMLGVVCLLLCERNTLDWAHCNLSDGQKKSNVGIPRG
jgi:hypothetical protein